MATLSVLQNNENKELWASKVALSQAVTELDEIVDTINDSARRQAAKNGAASEKAQSVRVLGDAAFEIAAAVKSCAVAGSNKYLAGQVNFSRSEITKGRDSSVLARCRAIHAAASEVISSLTDYEVTPAKLTALKKKIDAFDTAQSGPRQATASSSAATKELVKLFQQASEIFNDRLDGLIVPFKSTEPTFFNEYRTARAILDGKGSRVNKSSNVIAAPVTTAKAA